MQPPQLAQRGRAAIDFHCEVRAAASLLQRAVETELAAKGVTAESMPDNMDDRHQLVDRTMDDSKAYRARDLINEWSAKDHGPICQDAFNELRDELEPQLLALDEGPTTLEYDPDLTPPSYFSRVWFHRTTGGWDASEYNGFVHGELIHKLILTKVFGSNIFEKRREAAENAPRRDYARVLDMGASSGHNTMALSHVFPQAQIVGVDFSARMLEHARRAANEAGLAWKLYQRPAEATGFADESFGLVSSFNLIHEIPPRIIKAVFAEAFRLLEPGGDMVMVDVPRYADLDKMTAWRFDAVARWGGEPYWRSSASTDLKAVAQEVGFSEVEAYTLPGGPFYLVRGRKPARAS